MSFGTWLDEAGAFFDTVHFPEALKQYPFRGVGVYAIHGKVVQEFGFISLEVVKMVFFNILNNTYLMVMYFVLIDCS